MCGLWGFITGEKDKGATYRAKYAYQAAIAGTLRGTDSTGMFIVPHKPDGNADWCKIVGVGYEFVTDKLYLERMEQKRMPLHRAVIGHNRAATQGKVTTDNAHPFQEGPITLVHNGTLWYTSGMPVPMHHKDAKKIEVDSHLICHNLAHHDAKEVIESLEGAYALVWHDARTDSVYFARNSQRPLHFMKVECEDTVLFASEPDMLWWLAGRIGFKRGEVWSLDAGVLLEFKAGELKPVASRFSTTKAASYYKGSNYGYGYGYSYGGNSRRSGKTYRSRRGAAMQDSSIRPTRYGTESIRLLGFDPTEELEFMASDVIVNPGSAGRASINGWVYYSTSGSHTEAVQGVLHGVDAAWAMANKDEVLMVSPIAMQNIGKDNDVCLILLLRGLQDEGSSPWEKQHKVGDRAVSPGEWLAATRDGCVQCGTSLSLSESETVTWVGDRPRPMCGTCAEEWKAEVRMA